MVMVAKTESGGAFSGDSREGSYYLLSGIWVGGGGGSYDSSDGSWYIVLVCCG